MDSIDYRVNFGHNDFRTQIMTVEDLLLRYGKSDTLSSALSFRKPTVAQSSRIIESVLLGMPQPMIYIDDTNSKGVIIEGAEHLYAYYSFCNNGMELSSLYFRMLQYEGKSFSGMSPLAQSNILNTRIIVNVVNPGLTPHERFGIYMCLKSRADATSLRWCRSMIFEKEYQWIKELAKDVSRSKRTEALENSICYMLVGSYYELFLNGEDRNHIDVAANFLMEMVYKRGLIPSLRDDFRRVLEEYFTLSPIRPIVSPIDGFILSVNYHLYKLNGKSNIMKRPKALVLSLVTIDSAEAFSRAIDRTLKQMP